MLDGKIVVNDLYLEKGFVCDLAEHECEITAENIATTIGQLISLTIPHGSEPHAPFLPWNAG